MKSEELTDAFRHLPEIRERIVNPAQSYFRRIDFSDLDRRMAEQGREPGWRRSDESREHSRRRTMDGRWDKALWVFAYGSLMWDPAFVFDEVRRATLNGYHRRFCLQSELGRGTAERPGLMAGLDNGGSCEGLVYRIPETLTKEESRVVWCREMLLFSYVPTFLDLETPQGPVEALCFVADKSNSHYLPAVDIDETARRIGTAEGILGSNLDYLENLADYFEKLDIEDAELFRVRDKARAYAST